MGDPITLDEELVSELTRLAGRLPVARALLTPWMTDNRKGDFLRHVDGHIEFLPSSGDTSNPWSSPKRQKGRPGKAVRRVLANPNQFVDAEYEEFAVAIRALDPTTDTEWEMVTGRALKRHYLESNVDPRNRPGLMSCMRYRKTQPYLDIYADNPDRVKLLALVSGEGTLGRALVWFGATTRDGEELPPLMDRIYAPDAVVLTFRKRAEREGWAWKYHNTHGDSEFFFPDGKIRAIDAGVVLESHRYRYYPFLDTFSWYDKTTGTLATRRRDKVSWYQLTGTEGNERAGIGPTEIECDNCNSWYEWVEGETESCPYCEPCPSCGTLGRRDNWYCCQFCRGCGRFVQRNWTNWGYDSYEEDRSVCRSCRPASRPCLGCGQPAPIEGRQLCATCANADPQEVVLLRADSLGYLIGCDCETCCTTYDVAIRPLEEALGLEEATIG